MEKTMKTRGYMLVLISMVLLALVAVDYDKAFAQEQITLKYSAWTAPRGAFADTCNTYLDKIENRSNGRVKFERYWSGTLIPAKEEVAAVGKGVADITIVVSKFQKRLSLIQVARLPGLGITLDTAGPIVATELAKMKPIQDQFDKYNLKLVAINGGEPADIITSTPIRTIDDLKGKKVRCVGDAAVTLKQLGAIPVALTSSECYESFERGIVDGVIMPFVGIYVWRLHEAAGAKYFTRLRILSNIWYWMMNKDSWNRLPDDIKGIFKEVGEEQPAEFIKIYKNTYDSIYKAFDKQGIEMIDLPEAEKKKLADAAHFARDKWLKDQEKRGLPGQELLDKCLELCGQK
jgi:TRAP-type C4-dicarboxylate transport system substrate-binding protein